MSASGKMQERKNGKQAEQRRLTCSVTFWTWHNNWDGRFG